MSEPDSDNASSLIFYGSRELAAPGTVQNRILGEMVESSLALVRQDDAEKDAEEQYQTGERYFYGDDVPQDFAQAIGWYRKAAEKGHVLAQVELGSCYDLGIGVEEDGQQARYWYLKAADQGYVPAMRKLGVWYERWGEPPPMGST